MRLYFFTILLFCSNIAAGQTLAELEKQLDSLLQKQQRSEVMIGAGYGNNPAYGSKVNNFDNPIVLKPYLSPSVSYYHKSGWYAGVSSYYLLNSIGQPWFEWDLTAGYDYTKNRNFLTGISYTRYLFNDSSDVPGTPIKNELFAYFYYRKWWIEPGLSLDYGWGTHTTSATHIRESLRGNDFNLILSARHPFMFTGIFGLGDACILTPSTNVTLGTANYYSNLKAPQYLAREPKPFKGKGSGKELNFEDHTKFEARAIDITVNCSYFLNHFTITPSYTLFKPFTGNNQNVMSYFTTRLYYSF
ncbi:hypothetical protein SAMN05660909_04761 [Chitinophaga terrae (ex Kim and Jung 2007)]|uniref:Uncharacterized protein n=1 Tax=Chitinophaga terrae (ex Kim and Jung 2007) TaxID=408074 RepID=A0A1H4FXA3_9BACT|nr:hypothetical protein CTE07_43920 [Chitinophaga terrae (ex Kim and Jung 2007)]SEB01924.1 hypothetical protein SAMN05660909_04761 [Chitinophaga terrae (ex Kim and Jung 2007)]